LRPLGFTLRASLSWDTAFRDWIATAEATGRDPNDVGDEKWATDELRMALDRWYLPAVEDATSILELGPGTGRLTRHIVDKGATVTAFDRSPFVCEWMRKYLPQVEMVQISECRLPVARGTADLFLAHGVFEHFLIEEIFWFLEDAARALRPGGRAIFNFDNVMSDGGLEHILGTSRPSQSSVFRFHHPDAVARIALAAAFSDVDLATSETRTAFAILTR
jgi:SAM-dependent methyltransferase